MFFWILVCLLNTQLPLNHSCGRVRRCLYPWTEGWDINSLKQNKDLKFGTAALIKIQHKCRSSATWKPIKLFFSPPYIKFHKSINNVSSAFQIKFLEPSSCLCFWMHFRSISILSISLLILFFHVTPLLSLSSLNLVLFWSALCRGLHGRWLLRNRWQFGKTEQHFIKIAFQSSWILTVFDKCWGLYFFFLKGLLTSFISGNIWFEITELIWLFSRKKWLFVQK